MQENCLEPSSAVTDALVHASGHTEADAALILGKLKEEGWILSRGTDASAGVCDASAGPGHATLVELYDSAYRDWQALSVALLGREHGTREQMLAALAELRGKPR